MAVCKIPLFLENSIAFYARAWYTGRNLGCKGSHSMKNQKRKILHYIKLLDGARYTGERAVDGIAFCRAGYKKGNTMPPLSAFEPYTPGADWGSGNDSHAWFHFTFRKPEDMKGKPCELVVRTDHDGWGPVNPQFMIFVDGRMRQGIDMNHQFYRFDDEDEHDIYLYGYTGPRIPSVGLFLSEVGS